MPTEHLSDRALKTTNNDGKRIEIYDDHLIENGKLKKKGVKGLAVRISASGNKTFVYRYWYHDRTKRYTIGGYPDWSLSEARDKARELSKIVSEGKDPASMKQSVKNDHPITLGEYINRFKADYVERKLKASTQKTYKSRLRKIENSKLSKLPLRDVARPDLRSFLKLEAKDHPTNANRLQAILSKLFSEAIQDGHVQANPLEGMPKLTKEKSRSVYYTDEQLKAIWQAIEQEWEPMQSLLKMLLLTGQRRGETSKMKWEDVHNGVWKIPQTDTKNSQPHEVPLPNSALNLLKKMKPINSASAYVFASQRTGSGHLTYFGEVIDRIRTQTMLNDFNIHDLRRTVATRLAEMNYNDRVIGMILNHKGLINSNPITGRYIHANLTKQKAEALQQWAGQLAELTSPLSLQKSGLHETA